VNLFRSVRAVANASGDGAIDWAAVGEAATASTDPGSIDLSEAEIGGYRNDVREARARVSEVSGVDFALPGTIEIQDRHHWIDANVDTFRRVMQPLETQGGLIPGVARVANTGSLSFMLSFLARNVLGQYDPLLLADGDTDHALYFVHPNIARVARVLDVDEQRFRRWIAFHEVTHAAEFGGAPWLSTYLEERVEAGVAELSAGHLDRTAFSELNTAMTVVEGYAELLMDEAFDGEYADLRRKLDQRRSGRGPIAQLVRRVLGLGLKRRQYEQGKAFFEAVAEERGLAAASAVWRGPEYLPSEEELSNPALWVDRVDP